MNEKKLKYKTIEANSAEYLDKKLNTFADDNDIKFSQSHFNVYYDKEANLQTKYAVVVMYEEKEQQPKKKIQLV